MTRQQVRAALQPGDLRTTGRADEIAVLAAEDGSILRALVKLLTDLDPGVRMRAADALEKTSREHAHALQPYCETLLAVLTEARQAEVLWHMAVIVPRLDLSEAEVLFVLDRLQPLLQHKGSLVKTFAMQGIHDLAIQRLWLVSRCVDLLHIAMQCGTPAMQARATKLLLSLETP